MSEPSSVVSAVPIGLAAGGAIFLVLATIWAARPRGGSEKADEAAPGAASARSFAWIVIAGMAYSLLALAAAVHAPDTDGLRASILQLLAVLLAAALGGLAMSGAPNENGGRNPLASAGIFAAWLSLVGLPPAIGFHGKILVYRALLAAGWEWLAVLAVVGTAAALIPAFSALSSYRAAPLRGLRGVLTVVLLIAVMLLGIYPQAGLLAAAPLAGLASGR